MVILLTAIFKLRSGGGERERCGETERAGGERGVRPPARAGGPGGAAPREGDKENIYIHISTYII